jgi:hypothetical protein
VNGLAVISGNSEERDGGYHAMLRASGRTSKLLPGLVGFMRLASILVLTLVCVGAAHAGDFELYTTLDTEFTMESAMGPGAGDSLSGDGVKYQSILTVRGNQNGENDSQLFSIGLRVGDSLRLGGRTLSLTNLRWQKSTDRYRLNLGDTMEFFSQYALTNSFKGFSITSIAKEPAGMDLTVIAGYAYPRWENLYAGTEVKAAQRQVLGVRLASSQSSSSSTEYGVSMVHTSDKSGINPGDTLYDNSLYSLDFGFELIAGLNAKVVAAISDSIEHSSSGDQALGGTAYQIEFTSAAKQGRASFIYERISSGFLSLMGSAKPDRERVKLRIRSDFSKTMSLTVGYLYLRDNLDGQKPKTTTSKKPEISLNLKRVFDRRYASFDAALKFDEKRVGADRMVDTKTLSVSYRDRFGLIDTSVGILGALLNDVDGSSVSRTNDITYTLNLSTRMDVGQVALRSALNGALTTTFDHISGKVSQKTDVALEMRSDFPSVNANSSVKIGQANSVGTLSDSQKTYLSLSVYYRPGFLSSLRDGRLYLRAAYNDYRYPDASKNRSESSVTGGVSLCW